MRWPRRRGATERFSPVPEPDHRFRAGPRSLSSPFEPSTQFVRIRGRQHGGEPIDARFGGARPPGDSKQRSARYEPTTTGAARILPNRRAPWHGSLSHTSNRRAIGRESSVPFFQLIRRFPKAKNTGKRKTLRRPFSYRVTELSIVANRHLEEFGTEPLRNRSAPRTRLSTSDVP